MIRKIVYCCNLCFQIFLLTKSYNYLVSNRISVRTMETKIILTIEYCILNYAKGLHKVSFIKWVALISSCPLLLVLRCDCKLYFHKLLFTKSTGLWPNESTIFQGPFRNSVSNILNIESYIKTKGNQVFNCIPPDRVFWYVFCSLKPESTVRICAKIFTH
jgi:hypothetical protein